MHTKLNRRNALLICAALAASTVSVYYQVVRFDLLDWDDLKYVSQSTSVQKGLTIDSVRRALHRGTG